MAKLIDGKAVSAKVLEGIKNDLTEVRKEHPSFTPCLAIVQVCIGFIIWEK